MTKIEEIDNIHYLIDDYGININLSKKEIKILKDYDKLDQKLWKIFNCVRCERNPCCIACNEHIKKRYKNQYSKYIKKEDNKNLFKVFKSFFKGHFWARKFCCHCDEDLDNLCLSWTTGCPEHCNLFRKYIYCPGRNPKKDDRWIY